MQFKFILESQVVECSMGSFYAGKYKYINLEYLCKHYHDNFASQISIVIKNIEYSK